MHRRACAAGEEAYTDPESGNFVLSSVYLRAQGTCCGKGCRHCPWTEEEQVKAGRPDVMAWPHPPHDR